MHKAKLSNDITINSEELKRYARHLTLPEIGITGQKKLKKSSVLIIGSGGLGSPVLLYLAAAGIGKIGIVDSDVVEDSNLQRQIIFGCNSIGQAKTSSAKKRILDINPYCEVKTYETLLTNKNSLDIIKPFDIICDCTDNFPSRYLINDSCLILKKPFIYGSVDRFEGQVTVFNLNSSSPNYRDLVPNPPPLELIPSCSEAGVLGVMPGIIGLLQATEVIKIITGIGETLNGRLLVINVLKMQFKELNLTSNPKQKKISSLIDYQDFCSQSSSIYWDESENISVQEINQLMKSGIKDFVIIDVRNEIEHKEFSIPYSKLIPLEKIKNGEAIGELKDISAKKKLYIHCKTGARSKQALLVLKKFGIEGKNIIGGIKAWKEQIISNDEQ